MAAATEKKDAFLTQVKSLNPDDDERTKLSKLISWILRRGAGQAGVKQDPDSRWVKWSDLCAADVLKEHTSEYLWQVVVDYNGKKMRYEISEAAGGPYIRAYQNAEREAKGEVLVTKKKSEKGGKDKGGKGQSNEPAEAPAQALNPYMAAGMQGMDPYAMQASMQGMNPFQAAMMMQWQWAMQMQQMQAGVGGAAGGGAVAAAAAAPPWSGAGAGAGSNRLKGWVKSVNHDKGFGFITCPETYAEYQRDVFVRAQDLQGLDPGAEVTFACEKNKQGMPQARDVQGTGQHGAPKGKGKFQDGKGKGGKGKDGKGKDGKGKGKDGKDGKGGKEGKEGKKGKGKGGKEEKRPTLEMPKTVIADLGELPPPREIVADLGA